MASVTYGSERVPWERRVVTPLGAVAGRDAAVGTSRHARPRATQRRNPLMRSNTDAALLAVPVLFGLPLSASATDGPVVETGIAHRLVTEQKLRNLPGNSLTAVVLDIAPGGAS